jgi:hypothetical protein
MKKLESSTFKNTKKTGRSLGIYVAVAVEDAVVVADT